MATGPDVTEDRGAPEGSVLSNESAAPQEAAAAKTSASSNDFTPATDESAPASVEATLADADAAAKAEETVPAPAPTEKCAATPEAAASYAAAAVQESGKAHIDAAAAFAESLKAIMAEAADYSTKSLRERLAFYERLQRAKTLQNAMEIQSEYAKAYCAELVAETTKMRDLYSDLAKVAFRPLQTTVIVAHGAQ